MNEAKNLSPTGPVPGKWSVYDARGNLCATGYLNRGAAEMYAPHSERDQYKFVLEPEASSGEAIYTDEQEEIFSLLRDVRGGGRKGLGLFRAQAIMSGIADADSYLNNVAVPTYSEMVLAMRDLLEVVQARNSQGGGFQANAEGQRRIDSARELMKKAGL